MFSKFCSHVSLVYVSYNSFICLLKVVYFVFCFHLVGTWFSQHVVIHLFVVNFVYAFTNVKYSIILIPTPLLRLLL
jgi:hypothetical protein